MNLKVKVWRQKNAQSKGNLEIFFCQEALEDSRP